MKIGIYALIASFCFTVSVCFAQAESSAQIKSKQEIEKSLFPIKTRGLVPVQKSAAGDGAAAGTRIDLPAITFEYNSAVLTQQARQQLDQVAAALGGKDLSVLTLAIVGHTDAVGSDAYNIALSQRRASAAAAYLYKSHRFPINSFETSGQGERQLLLPNRPNNALNRRVEFIRQ